MIGHGREGDVAIERGKFAQLRRHQDAALLVNQDLMRTTDVEELERSHLIIEARLLANLFLQAGPFVRWICFEAVLIFEDGICDIDTIMTIALEIFAEADRDTHPAFFIDRVIEPSVKHRWSP